MKSPMVVCLALLFLPAGIPAQVQYRGGIVNGAEADVGLSMKRNSRFAVSHRHRWYHAPHPTESTASAFLGSHL